MSPATSRHSTRAAGELFRDGGSQKCRCNSVAEALGACAKPVRFLGGAVAIEHGIAMRKAAEARNDLAVLDRRVQRVLEGRPQLGRRFFEQAAEGGHRFVLYVERLGMLQGHIEEYALERVERRIGPMQHARKA